MDEKEEGNEKNTEDSRISQIDVKHLGKKINENYQTSNGYDSCDDIENQQLINISKLSSSDSSEKCFDTKVSNNDRSISKLSKKNFHKNLSIYRIMNSISILLIMITFFTISFTKLNESNYFLIAEHLTKAKIQSESNILILNMAFGIVTSKILL